MARANGETTTVFNRRQLLRAAGICALGAGSLVISACAPMKPATIPLREIRDLRAGGQRSKNLLVMMPGAQEQPEDFVSRGYVMQVRQRQIDVDILALDSHIGYFSQGNFADRLLKDVIQPARAQGYERIWLMGISLGGFGAFLFDAGYPDQIDGTIALAPYLGTRAIERQVLAAGGLMQWRPDPGQALADNDWETPLMLGLQRQAVREQSTARAGGKPRLLLGYGRSDRFAPALGLLKDALPGAQTLVVDGGHDWPAWNPLWEQILDRYGHLLDGSVAAKRVR